MHKSNPQTRILNSKKRDLGRRRAYEIFIDIGSYKTTILCLPHGDRNDERDRLGNIQNYLIPFKDDDREFPSSYFQRAEDIKLLSDEIMLAVKTGKANFFDRKKIITSAKRNFIHDFLNYPDGIDSNGKPTSFVLYIKALLEHTFKVIICDKPLININGNEVNVDAHWRSSDVPNIEGIQVTVPDLYIENLRQGYCKYILQACKLLCSGKNKDSWRFLLKDYIKYEKYLTENKNKKRKISQLENFVSISADESGAGELYFMESMKILSSLRFHKNNLDKYKVPHIEYLFSQKNNQLNTNLIKDSQKIICCRIDIGGITTDAGVSLVEFFDKSLSDGSDNKELRYKLLKKESFSQRVAGETFKKEFEKYDGVEDNWWNDSDFIKNDKLCSFTKTIKRIIGSQYKAVNHLMKKNDIDSIYFVISGRPTISNPVKEVLLQEILKDFNDEELLILKESCIFISELPLVYHDWMKSNWHIDYQPELAKWVTSAVGEKMLINSSKYDIATQEFDYYVKVDHYPPIDEGELQIVKGGEKSINLNGFAEFKSQIEDNAIRVGLSFSSKKDGEFISFLDVLNRSCKKEYPNEQNKCYPKLKVGSSQTALSTKSWIIPSIYIEDLEMKIHELVWKG